MKKVYYQLKMIQKSPLRVGNGDAEVTDSDLMLDGRGFPFIPGSSIAGVLREQYGKVLSASKKDVDMLFGYIDGEILKDSRLIVSDAVVSEDCTKDDFMISIRDGIGLDEWGSTISGHKYDFQVVETKKAYTAILEWSGEEAAYLTEIKNGLDILMQAVSAEGLLLGARTTRGYGSMAVEVRKKEFVFSEEGNGEEVVFPDVIDKWLAFDPFDKDAFAEADLVAAGAGDRKNMTIHLDLTMKGSFSVRVNTARAERLKEDGSIPDSLPLRNQDKNPVIPGTSWAGTFRHHMLDLLRQSGIEPIYGKEAEALNLLFGKSQEEGKHIRSEIRFKETAITGGAAYSITRNAVERFTQAPRNTALYTNRLWQGGKGELEITVTESKMTKLQRQLLAIALIDMDLGLMTVGGEAGVGRGRCMITRLTVNGQDKTAELKACNSHFLEGKA